jgi:hypothetical protein
MNKKNKLVPTEFADKYQPLFNLMSSKYNLNLSIDEMNEILIATEKLKE